MKYEITDIAHPVYTKLRRIRALVDIGDDVKAGDLGGYVESAYNLSQNGSCWVYDDARMHDNSTMLDHSRMHGNSRMHDDSRMFDYSVMRDRAVLSGDKVLSGDAVLSGSTKCRD